MFKVVCCRIVVWGKRLSNFCLFFSLACKAGWRMMISFLSYVCLARFDKHLPTYIHLLAPLQLIVSNFLNMPQCFQLDSLFYNLITWQTTSYRYKLFIVYQNYSLLKWCWLSPSKTIINRKLQPTSSLFYLLKTCS